MNEPGTTIQLTHLIKTYHTPAGEVPVLRDVNLTVKRGEFIGIVGKSGAGKSTLVNMVTGIDTLSSGSVVIGNTAIQQLNEDQRNAWRGNHIGIVYQSFELLPQITILENVLLPLDFTGAFHPIKSKDLAMKLLHQMEIDQHANKFPSEISGGQQQRVAIARALINQPEIIAADEPTGNLDSQTAQIIMALFHQLSSAGTTILMVTHHTQDVHYFSRVYELNHGMLHPISGRRKR